MRADLRYLLAGLAGTAGFTFLALAFPDLSRFFTIPAAIACFILTVQLVWPDIREFLASPRWGLRRMWPQYLMIVGGVLVFAGVVGFFQINVDPPKKDEPPKIAELPKGGRETEPNETDRLVSQAQFDKVKEIETFFGGKDESGLRLLFDIPNLFNRNVIAQSARIMLRRSGRANEFNYMNFTYNGQLIMWVKDEHDLPRDGRPIVPGMGLGPSGPNPQEGPQDVRYLVMTPQFLSATAKLTQFQNSALVPDTIKKQLEAFNADLSPISDVILKLMDEYLHKDEGYFVDHWTLGSPHFNVLNNEFAGRMPHLKPGADRILAAISIVWKVNR